VHVYCIPVCNLFIKFHIFKSSSEKTNWNRWLW
jgi:hypothetical protein